MSRMGSEVARLRKEVGMTQKQLGKLVGVNESYIVDVENGKRVINGDLAARISKALRQEVGRLDLYEGDGMEAFDQPNYNKPEPAKNVVKVVEKPVQAIWNDALAGVLKAVPVYGYRMDKVLETRQLPIISNKIEGFPKDKVCYLKVEDDDMGGFRISKGDLVLCNMTQDVEKDGIYLLELDGQRMIRQIRKLEANKLLLVYKSSGLMTQTASKKDVKILARLVRIEIVL